MYIARHFRARDHDFLNAVGPPRGAAFDFESVTRDGGKVRLSELRGRPVVIETGSTTCPIYVNLVDRWNAVVDRHPEAEFLVLYVREAHPGSRIDANASMVDKLVAARDLDTWGERRAVWVDDLEGTAHRMLDAQSNSLLVVDAEGRAVYFAAWSDPDAADAVLDRLARGEDPTVVPARDRLPRPAVGIRVLRRAGLRAGVDFMVGVPRLVPKRIRYRRRMRARSS